MSKQKTKNDALKHAKLPKHLNWKEKAKSRANEIKTLKRKLKEITLSRDKWKNKYFIAKSNNKILENELASIKKKNKRDSN